jgi:hypothetical protein
MKPEEKFGSSAGFLLGLLFVPEDEGDTFHRNVGRLSSMHGVIFYRQNSS